MDGFPFLIKQSAWDENLVPKNTGCGMTGNTSSWENPVTWMKPGIISQPFCHHCPDKSSAGMVLDKGGTNFCRKPEVSLGRALSQRPCFMQCGSLCCPLNALLCFMLEGLCEQARVAPLDSSLSELS